MYAEKGRFVVRMAAEKCLKRSSAEEERSLAKREVIGKARCRTKSVTASRKVAVTEGIEDTDRAFQVPVVSMAPMTGGVEGSVAMIVMLARSRCHDYALGEVSGFVVAAVAG